MRFRHVGNYKYRTYAYVWTGLRFGFLCRKRKARGQISVQFLAIPRNLTQVKSISDDLRLRLRRLIFWPREVRRETASFRSVGSRPWVHSPRQHRKHFKALPHIPPKKPCSGSASSALLKQTECIGSIYTTSDFSCHLLTI